MTDSSLIREIKRNNITCYEQLIRKYTPYVIAVSYKVSGQRLKEEDIEEITSDIFIKLWEIRADLEIQKGKEKAYIGKMTRNITLNVLKKKSFTHNGITMNVETAVAGNSNGIIIIRLTKDDGTPFKAGSEFKKFKVEVDKSSSTGYSHGWQMSKDNKQLTYIITINTDDALVGKKVRVIGDEIVIVSPKEEVVAINLEDDTLANGEGYVVGAERNEPKGIDLKHPYSDIVLSDVGFREGMFLVEMEYTDAEYEPWQLFRLIDTRTHENLEDSSSESYWSSSESENEKTLKTNRQFFEDITKADLPYLKLVKMYNEYEEIATGKWQVEFILEKNKNVKQSKKKYKIPFGEDSLIVKEVELSAVGGKINGIIQLKEGEGVRPDFVDEMNILLKMKDGTTKPMRMTLSSYGGHGREYLAQIQLGKPWHQYTEEEKEKLREEGRVNRYKRNQGIDGLFPEDFIEVNKIESIQIEEITIPLS